MNNLFKRAFHREGYTSDEVAVECPECGGSDTDCFLCKGLGFIAKDTLEAEPSPEPMRPDRGINFQHGYTGKDSSWTGY